MADQLPALDAGSSLWLEKVQVATKNSTSCAVPPKYFNILSAWGYVTGEATAAKLTPEAQGQLIAEEQAAKQHKKSKKKKK